MKPNHKLKGLTGVLVALCLCAGAVACRDNPVVADLTLELLPGAAAPAELNTDSVIVVRCADYYEGLGNIGIKTSRSMEMDASYLVFLDQTNLNAGQGSVDIAVAPVTGKEYEYDMTLARWYRVSLRSAEEVTALYGITYADWEYGAVNGSEKFPCCE